MKDCVSILRLKSNCSRKIECPILMLESCSRKLCFQLRARLFRQPPPLIVFELQSRAFFQIAGAHCFLACRANIAWLVRSKSSKPQTAKSMLCVARNVCSRASGSYYFRSAVIFRQQQQSRDSTRRDRRSASAMRRERAPCASCLYSTAPRCVRTRKLAKSKLYVWREHKKYYFHSNRSSIFRLMSFYKLV